MFKTRPLSFATLCATIFWAAAFSVAAIGSVASWSWASDEVRPQIREISVTNSEDELLAYFSLINGITPEILTALKSGIPVRYLFEIELMTPGFFGKHKLAQTVVTRTLHYDSLKGEYRVDFGPDTPRVVSVRTLAEVENVAFQINDVPVIRLANLDRGQDHILRVKAQVEKLDSSLPFQWLMEAFSSWGFETEWYEIRFRY